MSTIFFINRRKTDQIDFFFLLVLSNTRRSAGINLNRVTQELVTPNFQIIFLVYFFIKTSHVNTFELKTMKMKLKNFYENIFFIFFHQIKKLKIYF